MDRRTFLKGGVAATGALSLAVMAGCSPSKNESSESSAGAATAEEWYGAPQDPGSFDIVQTIDTEVLVCGLGAGGIVATAYAAQQGLKVTAIEKAGDHGGIKSYIGVIDASMDAAEGIHIDHAEIVNEHTKYANGWTDPRLIRMWADESGATFDWLAEVGAEFGATPYFETDVAGGTHGAWRVYPISHGFHYEYTQEDLDKAQAAADETGDPSVKVQALPSIGTYVMQKAEEWGADLHYLTSLVQLVQNDSGKVTGAIAQSGDGYIQINASKGVILATGGYEADADLLAKLNPDAACIGGVSMTAPGNTGDGIKAGIWAGGSKDQLPTLMTFERAAIAPNDELGAPYMGTSNWMGDQPFLKVNVRGERVCCETSPYDYPLAVASQQPRHRLACIWDANYQDNIKAFHTIGCSRIDPSTTTNANGVPTGEGLTFEANALMIAGTLEAGIAQQADTLEELADKLGIPSDTFVTTVKRYNELAASGVDSDFGKPAKDLIALDTPPYTGCFFGGHVLCTLDGLKIDKDCHVLDSEKEPIDGLFAIGNCSGSAFATVYPELLIGCANGRTITQGRHVINLLLGK